MELAEGIRQLMRRDGLRQQDVADQAGVSQSTVSRAVRGRRQRVTKEYVRLCSYIQDQGFGPSAPTKAHVALDETWDGSDQHAEALAVLIKASKELWPDLGLGHNT